MSSPVHIPHDRRSWLQRVDGGVSGSSLTSLALANAGGEPSVQECIFTIVVEHAVPGDGNGDGWVDGLDYLLWAAKFGTHPVPDGDVSDGDYNDDGWIDGLDYLLWAGNFGSHAVTNVPEPGAGGLLVGGVVVLLVRFLTSGNGFDTIETLSRSGREAPGGMVFSPPWAHGAPAR